MCGFTVDPTTITAHRPWPLPRRRWVAEQRWSNLLFAHWPMPAATVERLIPRTVALDTYAGDAWITVAPFALSHLRARGTPMLPWLSHFPELNLRTYVMRDDKPGVYFWRLDATRLAAVLGARLVYHLPYIWSSMRIEVAADGWVTYDSRGPGPDGGRAAARFHARYRPIGPVLESQPGSLEHWLTERYCLYATDARGETAFCTEIHHRQWPLQAVEVEIAENTIPPLYGLTLDGPPRLASFTPTIDVVTWLPERCQ